MDPQRNCLTVDHCPWLGLSELGAAPMIVLLPRRALIYSMTHRWGKVGLWKRRRVLESETVLPSAAFPHLSTAGILGSDG